MDAHSRNKAVKAVCGRALESVIERMRDGRIASNDGNPSVVAVPPMLTDHRFLTLRQARSVGADLAEGLRMRDGYTILRPIPVDRETGDVVRWDQLRNQRADDAAPAEHGSDSEESEESEASSGDDRFTPGVAASSPRASGGGQGSDQYVVHFAPYRVYHASQLDGLPDDCAQPGRPLPYNPVSGHIYSGVNAVLLQSAEMQIAERLAQQGSHDIGAMIEQAGDASEIERAAADSVQQFIEAMGLSELVTRDGTPAYRPMTDTIFMPPTERYVDGENASWLAAYTAVLAHEAGHATGHPERENRPLVSRDRDLRGYALEEFRAEFFSMMVSRLTGLPMPLDDDHVRYIDSWLSEASQDPTRMMRQVSKMTDPITVFSAIHDRDYATADAAAAWCDSGRIQASAAEDAAADPDALFGDDPLADLAATADDTPADEEPQAGEGSADNIIMGV